MNTVKKLNKTINIAKACTTPLYINTRSMNIETQSKTSNMQRNDTKLYTYLQTSWRPN